MAVKIRLARHGAKKRPYYRIVVANASAPRDGRFIDEVGRYNPCTDPAMIKFDLEKVDKWIANGAQPTDTVARLLEDCPRGRVTMSALTEDLAGLVDAVVRPLVEVEEELDIAAEETEDGVVLVEIHVSEGDVGKVIGRQGRCSPSRPFAHSRALLRRERASRWKWSLPSK